MKNITALAVLVIISGTFAVNNLLCQTQERTYDFSIAPQIGFVHGRALEVVYPVDTPADLLSELRWEMKPVFYLGAQIDFGRLNPMKGPGFFSSMSFRVGFSGESGVMEDRDWMSVENSSLTHFSSHTNETRKFYWMDIAAGASLPINHRFYIKPFLSGSWMLFSYEGKDGYGKYARPKDKSALYSDTFFPIDDNPIEYTYSGVVIRYTQEWYLFAAGLIFGIMLPADFSLDLSFQISPLAFCAAVDEHLTRNVKYMDITSRGLFLEPKCRLAYTVNQLEFSFEYAYRHIRKTRGTTYQKNAGGDYFANGEGGAGLSLSDTRFLVKILF